MFVNLELEIFFKSRSYVPYQPLIMVTYLKYKPKTVSTHAFYYNTHFQLNTHFVTNFIKNKFQLITHWKPK